MSAQVIQLASEDSVDRAWEAYAVEARKLLARPELLLDREFNQEIARKHERWKRLFLIQDGGR